MPHAAARKSRACCSQDKGPPAGAEWLGRAIALKQPEINIRNSRERASALPRASIIWRSPHANDGKYFVLEPLQSSALQIGFVW